MNIDSKSDNHEIVQEQARRIYDLYTAKSKNYRSLFMGLIGFALLFFVIIQYPFVFMQGRNDGISKRKKALEEELEGLDKRMSTLKRVQNGIGELRGAIDRSPANLREIIQRLAREGPSMLGNPGELQDYPNVARSDHGEEIASGTEEGRERNKALFERDVEVEISRMFSRYKGILNDNVVAPLQSHHGKLPPSIKKDEFLKGLEDLDKTFKDELKENPRFWVTFGGKVEFSGKLTEAVDGFWAQYGKPIDEDVGKLKKEVNQLKDSIDEIHEEQAVLSSNKKKLEERLKQIEFPFGKIPIGINETIAIFPILLVIGFYICNSMLCDLIRLRFNYYQYSRRIDPAQDILTDNQISLVAPIWIDPINRERNRTIRYSILFGPFLIFVVSCLFNIYSWTIPESSSSVGQLPQWIYGALYALGLGVFLFGHGKARAVIRQHSHIHSNGNA